MSFDLVIRGGRVVDGSGLPGRVADIAINGERIVEIGRITARGDKELDAEGRLVTPGFIDVHTHMDAQINWDPLGTSSCWQGVTTAVMGNCGFTLAPVRSDARALVVRNLERAEDISAAAMQAGIDWRWEDFPQYMDAVEHLPMGINYAVNIGHSALRTWAMGERAFVETASEGDMELMVAQVCAALDAGAVGFTTSRSHHHETSDDKPVASRLADWSEIQRLVSVVGAGGGIFELAQEPAARSGDAQARSEFFERVRRLTAETGAMITFGVLPQGPRKAWEAQLSLLDDAAATGGCVIGQSHSRGVSILSSFRTTLPFDRLPQWQEVRRQPLEEQKQRLRDPVVRARLIQAAHHCDYGRAIGAEAPKPNWDHLRVYDRPLPPYPSVAQVAAERGVDPVEVIIDLAIERDFDLFFISTLDPVVDEELLQIMRHPRTVMSFSDAGAHASQIVDACIQTHLLAHWARDRKAFSIEDAVRMITFAPASYWGFAQRGLLRPGYIADINVIDLDRLSPGMPQTAHDLPASAQRLIMKSQGIEATIVGGQILMRNCEHSGRLPGRLLRRKRGIIGAADN
jgi:N-acyl-D-amino-acid deacylase